MITVRRLLKSWATPELLCELLPLGDLLDEAVHPLAGAVFPGLHVRGKGAPDDLTPLFQEAEFPALDEPVCFDLLEDGGVVFRL